MKFQPTWVFDQLNVAWTIISMLFYFFMGEINFIISILIGCIMGKGCSTAFPPHFPSYIAS